MYSFLSFSTLDLEVECVFYQVLYKCRLGDIVKRDQRLIDTPGNLYLIANMYKCKELGQTTMLIENNKPVY